ncbi:MAG: DUF4286 family protein [Cyclobacteriaceae bacterium]|nr:DUF4286 family protein [Cyclobacteriaceae bacterium]
MSYLSLYFKISYFVTQSIAAGDMILYNITFNIEPEIKGEWFSWMKNKYCPYVLESGYFNDFRIFHLLSETENDGLTYSVQFFADTLDHVNAYLEKHAPRIVHAHNEAFRHKHVSFMSILESVD